MKGVAVDCIGLPVCVAHELELLERSIQFYGYGRLPKADGHLESVLASYLDPIAKELMAPGDVALMVTPKAAYPMHLGILGDYHIPGNLSLIHATMDVISNEFPKGKVVEHRLSDKFKDRIVAVYRFRGLA